MNTSSGLTPSRPDDIYVFLGEAKRVIINGAGWLEVPLVTPLNLQKDNKSEIYIGIDRCSGQIEFDVVFFDEFQSSVISIECLETNAYATRSVNNKSIGLFDAPSYKIADQLGVDRYYAIFNKQTTYIPFYKLVFNSEMNQQISVLHFRVLINSLPAIQLKSFSMVVQISKSAIKYDGITESRRPGHLRGCRRLIPNLY